MTEGLIMICQRCGFCCNHLDGTIDPDDRNSMIRKSKGRKCPHLAYSGEVAVCTIHDLSCYRGTPCDLFDQFGPEDGLCILGGYFKSSGSAKL
jgi:hypothetical protein